MSPLISHITMGGCTVVALSYHMVIGGATSPRTKNSRGPSARQRRLRLGSYRTPLEQLRQVQASCRRTAVVISAELLPCYVHAGPG